jgi:cell division protein FtsB
MVDTREEEGIAGFSLKTFLVTALGILLFGIYVGVLMYGENSLTVLNKLKEEKQTLQKEKKDIRTENQRLQKEFFELKQLEPKE